MAEFLAKLKNPKVIISLVAILVLASVAIFTAVMLYQRNAVAPNAPESTPSAQESRACQPLAFTLDDEVTESENKSVNDAAAPPPPAADPTATPAATATPGAPPPPPSGPTATPTSTPLPSVPPGRG